MIYCFLANGFEEIEALAPVDILRRAELKVITVGVGGKEIDGAHGIKVVADIEESEVLTDNMDMVILPGGMPGTINLDHSPIVSASVDYCYKHNLPIGAICAAPSVLGHLGVLKGKRATCFPGFESELDCAEFTGEPVTRDGNIITSRGAGCAVEFGLEIVSLLLGEERAEKLKGAMQCP